MVSRRKNFGERSEPAPDRGGELQSAGGGGGRHKVTFRHCRRVLNSRQFRQKDLRRTVRSPKRTCPLATHHFVHMYYVTALST